MFTRPADLCDEEVRDAVASAWALDVASAEHLKVGFGSHHWDVSSRDGCRWFAKADDLRTRRVDPGEPLVGPLARLHAPLATAWACEGTA